MQCVQTVSAGLNSPSICSQRKSFFRRVRQMTWKLPSINYQLADDSLALTGKVSASLQREAPTLPSAHHSACSASPL
jgi:hypothetical protein